MKKITITLVVMALAISCKNNQTNNQTDMGSDEAVVLENPDKLVDIFLDDKTTPLFDTLRLGELIASVKYIPLEMTKQSYLGTVMDIHSNNDHYYISHGTSLGSARMLAFDNEGKYLYDIYAIGRGHNEIMIPLDRFYNDSKNKIGIASSGGEILIVDELTHKSKKKRFEELDFPFRPRSLKNGGYVGIPYDYTIDNKGPFMIIYDSLFNVVNTISDDRNRKHRNIEGVTTSPMLKRILSQSGEKVLYKDMDNDTVFSVNEDGSLVPSIVIEIPKKLKPTLRESEVDTKKKKRDKIYLDDIFMTKDYVVISYYFQDLKFTGFWSKITGKLVYRSASFFGMYPFCYEFNNIKGQSEYNNLNVKSNKILTTIPSSIMKHEIEGLKDDDNPVLVEITLVDAKTVDHE